MLLRHQLTRTTNHVWVALLADIVRHDKSINVQQTLARLRRYTWLLTNGDYALHAALAFFWLSIMPVPSLFKLFLVITFSLR
jgi:inositol phosphorylceramide synthase catalytic subunit